MNEANMQIAAATQHSRVGNLVRAGILGVAVLAGAAACGGANNPETVNAVSATSPDKTTVPGAAPAAGAFEFNGNATPGDDATVRAEDDANLYDCGGVKGETYKNADGTDKPFDPDHLISHMNAHPELAKSDSDFWVGFFGEKGMSFLATKGIGNKQHNDDQKVTAPGVAEGYPNFIANQVAAKLEVDALAGNFACKDAAGNYRVFPVGPKQLKAGETTLTGIALTKADYEQFVGIVAGEGKNLDQIFTQEMKADTDGDGKGDLDIVMVFNKHEMCANNELKLPPAIPNSPEAPTVPPVVTTTRRNTPTTPTVTYSVPPNVTTTVPTTWVGPKENPHPPVTGGAPTTVEAPIPGPSHPTTSQAPEKSTTTQTTIKVTVPSTTPPGDCQDC